MVVYNCNLKILEGWRIGDHKLQRWHDDVSSWRLCLRQYKGNKSRRLIVKKTNEEEVRSVAGQPFTSVLENTSYQSMQAHKSFFEEIDHLTHECPKTSLQKAEVGVKL